MVDQIANVSLEPDYNFSPDATFVPLISTEEMYDTIVFFRDCKDSPRKIALKRDSVRMMGSFAMNPPTAAGGMNMNAFMDTNGFYMGTGLRSLDKVKQDEIENLTLLQTPFSSYDFFVLYFSNLKEKKSHTFKELEICERDYGINVQAGQYRYNKNAIILTINWTDSKQVLRCSIEK